MLLVLYNRQMRYQNKPLRSFTYLQRQSQNKENNNSLNVNNKPLNSKEVHCHLPIVKLRLEHKLSDNTNYLPHIASSSKEAMPEQLKRAYSYIVGKDYSADILSHYLLRVQNQKDMLSAHGISVTLRSKMVDWMIQVLASYKMSQETFFRSIYMMDSYLKRSEQRMEVKDLHLIGLTAMFSAAKCEQIHPFKLSIISDKIARKKFKKTQILDKETDMMRVLGFKLQTPSIYDIARHIIEDLKFQFSDASSRYYNKILLYLSKMALFSQELAEEDPTRLAGAVVFIALKTLEQVDEMAKPQKMVQSICNVLQIEEQEMIEISRKVLQLAKNFSKLYPTLLNLKKFNKFEYGID